MGIKIEDLELGPAKYTHNSVTVESISGANLATTLEDFEVSGELSGRIHRRRIGLKAEVTFTPGNQVTTGILGMLYPHLTRSGGDSIWGVAAVATKPLAIATQDGKLYQILDAAVSRMPDLNFAVNKNLFGDATFVGRIARSIVPTQPMPADSLVKRGTQVWAAPTFGNTDFVVGTPLLTWGSGDGFDAIESDDGWTASFDMASDEVKASGRLRDVRYKGLEVMVKGIPADSLPSDIIDVAEMNTDVLNSGESTRAIAKELTLVMGALTLTIPLAAPVSSGFRFNTQNIRVGEIGFVSVLDVTGPTICTIVKA